MRREFRAALLSDWPIDRPDDWTSLVNRAMPQKQLGELRTAIERGRPFGSESWVKRMIDAILRHAAIREFG